MEMNIATPAIVLGLASLVWIALLARIFFLPGEWNLQWWLNTAPFVVAGLGMVGVLTGVLTPLVDPGTATGAAIAVASVLVVAGALGLGGLTLGTHRRRLALWHQDDDHPEHVVTEGPYALVRHPFYTSYIVSMVGCVLAAPHPITLLMTAVVALRLNRTAAREEARFLASEELGQTYAHYMGCTGRFLPRWRRRDCGSGGRGRMFEGRAAEWSEGNTTPIPEGRSSDVRASMDGSRAQIH